MGRSVRARRGRLPDRPDRGDGDHARLGVPRRIVSIVEGESLVNDGTALVAYRVAVVAAISGVFSIWEAGVAFVLSVAGGVVVGLGVA